MSSKLLRTSRQETFSISGRLFKLGPQKVRPAWSMYCARILPAIPVLYRHFLDEHWSQIVMSRIGPHLTYFLVSFSAPFSRSGSPFVRLLRRPIWRSGAHNGLVGGSSPPGPTTHSFELGNFPLCVKRPRTGGLCRRCSGLCRDQFRRGGDFGRVVSGLEIRLPGNGDRCQAETRFD